MKKLNQLYNKLIKESLDDYELKKAVYNIVNKAKLPEGLDKKQVADDIFDLIYGKDFDTVGDLEQGVLDYIEKTYGAVIEESISDGQLDEAITRAVYSFGVPDDVDEMDLIGEIEWNLNAGDFSDEWEVEDTVNKYLTKRFGHSAYQSTKKKVSKRKIIKEDNNKEEFLEEFNNLLKKYNLNVGIDIYHCEYPYNKTKAAIQFKDEKFNRVASYETDDVYIDE